MKININDKILFIQELIAKYHVDKDIKEGIALSILEDLVLIKDTETMISNIAKPKSIDSIKFCNPNISKYYGTTLKSYTIDDKLDAAHSYLGSLVKNIKKSGDL